jgi:hypothetical protein
MYAIRKKLISAEVDTMIVLEAGSTAYLFSAFVVPQFFSYVLELYVRMGSLGRQDDT